MSESDSAFVKFSEVQKSYDGETLVVKNLNLDIARGEFVTMLGPSGSGKTTCLMMLAGFETATHGEIYLDGQGINNVAPHKRNIGMVFQNYALFPHMTVAENLAFPLQVRKRPASEIKERVDRALDMVRLTGFGTRRPAQLSGGQQQRVALARALVFEPKLVLLDEPLGALDKNLREEMQYELKHIHANLGLTMVFVKIDSGDVVKAKPVNVSAVGDKTTLSLRPERVFVNPQSGATPNLLEAKVLELIYLGDHIRTRVEVAGNDQFVVKIPNSHEHSQLVEGQVVNVGWESDDCRALDA